MGLAGALIGGAASLITGQQAADAQEKAARRSQKLQQEMFDYYREQQQPYQQVGTNALYQMGSMVGLPGREQLQTQNRLSDLRGQLSETQKYLPPQPRAGGPYARLGTGLSRMDRARMALYDQSMAAGGEQQINPEYQRLQEEIAALEEQQGQPQQGGGDFDITETPGYEFRMDQGMNALNRSLASTGNRLSGRAAKAAQRYGQGLASQEFQNRFNRLASLAGRGQTAAQGVGQAGLTTGQNVGAAMGQVGAAQAGGFANINQAVQGGIGNYLADQQYNQLLDRLGGGGGMPSMSGPYGVQAGR